MGKTNHIHNIGDKFHFPLNAGFLVIDLCVQSIACETFNSYPLLIIPKYIDFLVHKHRKQMGFKRSHSEQGIGAFGASLNHLTPKYMDLENYLLGNPYSLSFV